VAAQKKSKKKASKRSAIEKNRNAKGVAGAVSKKRIASAGAKTARAPVSKSVRRKAGSKEHLEHAGSSKSVSTHLPVRVPQPGRIREDGDKKISPDHGLDGGRGLSVGAALEAGPDSKKIAESSRRGNEVMEAVAHKNSGKSLSMAESVGDIVSPDRSAANETSHSAALLSPKTANALSSAKVLDGEDGATAKVAKSGGNKHGFKTGEFIVYPSHGVGQIVSIEEKEVAGFRLELFVISFAKDKMTLRVPIPKVSTVGMRKLSDDDTVKRALETLLGRARVKRTMWSRRAQEYEAKINSGDLVAIAEVVRDLYRSEAQPEQSYSERQLYEAALDRISREIAVVQKFAEGEALKIIESQLQKGQRRPGRTEANADAAGSPSADVEEAA
jgi:CarD family transcriptional regulator